MVIFFAAPTNRVYLDLSPLIVYDYMNIYSI